jgi:flagellar biosynthesis protein FliQ
VYTLAAITTFSTATYFALGVLVSIYFTRLKNKNFRLLLVPIIVLVFLKVYYSADFLKTKISSYYNTISGDYQHRVANRFTSVLLDLKKIKEHPIFGNPQNTGAKYTIYSHRNNGLSSMAVEYGIVYFIGFFVLISVAFKRLLLLYHNYSLILLISLIGAILAIYFGQVLTNKPIFNLLTFWPFFLRSLLWKKSNYAQNLYF